MYSGEAVEPPLWPADLTAIAYEASDLSERPWGISGKSSAAPCGFTVRDGLLTEHAVLQLQSALEALFCPANATVSGLDTAVNGIKSNMAPTTAVDTKTTAVDTTAVAKIGASEVSAEGSLVDAYDTEPQRMRMMQDVDMAQLFRLRQAGMGRGVSYWASTNARGDFMQWITPLWRHWLRHRTATLARGVDSRCLGTAAGGEGEAHPKEDWHEGLHAGRWLHTPGEHTADTEAYTAQTSSTSPLSSEHDSTVDDKLRHALHALAPVFSLFERCVDSLRHQPTTATLGFTPLPAHHPYAVSIQLAKYPGNGAGYTRHLDSFAHTQDFNDAGDREQFKRLYTVIFYPNVGWKPEHGGQLRVFASGDEAVDIAPRGNRLLVFRSIDVPHQVLPSYAPRWAITMFYYARMASTSKESMASCETSDTSAIPNAAAPATNTEWHMLQSWISKSRPETKRISDLIDSYITGKPEISAPESTATPAGRVLGTKDTGAAVLRSISDARSPAAGQGSSSPHPEPRAGDLQRIFVAIPAYRDPELLPTVVNLFKRAALPCRVHVGVCIQDDADALGTSLASFLTNLQQHLPHLLIDKLVTFVGLDARRAAGPLWARHLISSLYHGEEFVLCIDSHMRFIEQWDLILIDQLGAAEAASGAGRKAILTTYPAGYELVGGKALVRTDDIGFPNGQQAVHLNNDGPHCLPTLLCPIVMSRRESGGVDAIPRYIGKRHIIAMANCLRAERATPSHLAGTTPLTARDLLKALGMGDFLPAQLAHADGPSVQNESESAIPLLHCPPSNLLSSAKFPPLPSAGLAAGFLFCRGTYYTDVCSRLPATELRHLFFGEEALLYSLTLSSGYAVYAPGCGVALHCWHRSERAHGFREFADGYSEAIRAQSELRARQLLGSKP